MAASRLDEVLTNRKMQFFNSLLGEFLIRKLLGEFLILEICYNTS